jgi:hypothetical protein
LRRERNDARSWSEIGSGRAELLSSEEPPAWPSALLAQVIVCSTQRPHRSYPGTVTTAPTRVIALAGRIRRFRRQRHGLAVRGDRSGCRPDNFSTKSASKFVLMITPSPFLLLLRSAQGARADPGPEYALPVRLSNQGPISRTVGR